MTLDLLLVLVLQAQAGSQRPSPPPLAAQQLAAQAPGGQTLADVRAVIASGNVAWGKARVAYDRQHFETMLTPDFYVLSGETRMTRQQFIDQISTRGPVRLARFDASVLTVSPEGDGWVAVIQEKLEFERPVADGTVERAYALWITRDLWRQVDGQWRIGFSQVAGSELWRGGTKPPFKDW